MIGANLNAGDSTTNLDCFDVNGDRYRIPCPRPVQYNQGVVDPTTGQGAFADRQPVAMGFGDLRSTTNGSFRLGFDSGGVGHMINLANSEIKDRQARRHLRRERVDGLRPQLDPHRFLDVNGDGLPDHVAGSRAETATSASASTSATRSAKRSSGPAPAGSDDRRLLGRP